MAVTIYSDMFLRFTKSLTDWFAANSSIATMLKHTSASPKIWVKRGDEAITVRPVLILDMVKMVPFLDDVDSVYISEVTVVAYANSRVEALSLAGLVLQHTSQDPVSKRDAGFFLNSIRTIGVKHFGILGMGESVLDPSSIRRTERSDAPLPDRNVATVALQVRWRDEYVPPAPPPEPEEPDEP